MMKKDVTIKDISEACGVSIATVSRVINGNGRFSEDTRQRVLAAIDQLGYVSTKTRRGGTSERLIAIFVNSLDYETSSTSVMQLQELLFAHHFASVVCNIGTRAEKHSYYYGLMLEMGACAIIMMVNVVSPDFHNFAKLPTVYLYKRSLPEGLQDDHTVIINTDDSAAGYLAARVLAEAGCRRIGEVRMKSLNDQVPLGRHLGLLQYIYEHNLEYAQARSVTCEGYQFVSALRQVNQMLDDGQWADGYFCTSDILALALIRGLEAHGVRVPEDVKVIGCNDMSVALYTNKPITTIHHRIADMCAAAITEIEKMLDGVELAPEERFQTFGVDLVRRQTT